MENQSCLTKGSVSVRPLAPEDAPLLLKWMTDPRVLEWYEGRDQAFTPERVQEKFFAEEPGLRRWAVLYDGRAVGYAQTYPLDEEGLEEYGLPPTEERVFAMDQFIGEPDCWGKRIGRTFVSLLVSYLTEREGAAAVVLDPRVSNPRAVRCYEACGFRKIKLLPAHELHEGRNEDCWLMVSVSGGSSMKQRRRRSRSLPAALLTLGAAAVLIAAFFFPSNGPGSFPLWEKAVEYSSNGDLSLEFQELAAGCSSGNMVWDELRVHIKNAKERSSYSLPGVPFQVDYLSGGTWHTVYRPRFGLYGSAVWNEDNPQTVRLPAGLCALKGTYRLSAEKMGSCEFTVSSPPPKAPEGSLPNDFPVWTEITWEDNLSPDKTLSLEFQEIRYDQETDSGIRCDEICLIASSKAFDYISGTCPGFCRVDYLSDGKWYAVKNMGAVPMAVWTEASPSSQTFSVPRGLLSHTGRYRLYWYDMGYCEFDVSQEDAVSNQPLYAPR